jgi:hypothetical protein
LNRESRALFALFAKFIMPAYAFEGAIALVSAACVDALVFGYMVAMGWKKGSIKLTQDETQFVEEKDLFNVTALSDWEHGQAIDEKLFWTKVSPLSDGFCVDLTMSS